MRHIGSFSEERPAALIVDYLATQGIAATFEEADSHWEVWVRDEDRVEEARRTVAAFKAAPDDPTYRAAAGTAAKIRQQESQRHQKVAQNYIDVRKQVFTQPIARRAPLTATLIALSILVALASNFGSNESSVFYRGLSFADGRAFRAAKTADQRNGLAEIQRGEVWRVITPIFLHFSIVHLVFNLAWLYSLGGMIENRAGGSWTGLIVLASAVVGNLAQYMFTQNPLFGGMSGVVYGLLGYIAVRMWIAPRDHLRISRETLGFMLILLALGFTGALDGIAGGGIANWAHLGGLIGGVIVASCQPELRSNKGNT